MSTTFHSSARVLSIGIFFSLMVTGLARTLPATLNAGLSAHGVAAVDAGRVASLPPVSVLLASLLGYNPVQTLLDPAALSQLPPSDAEYLTGRGFIPGLISDPLADGLNVAFGFAIVACLVAAVASALRGGKYAYGDGTNSKIDSITVAAPNHLTLPTGAGSLNTNRTSRHEGRNGNGRFGTEGDTG